MTDPTTTCGPPRHLEEAIAAFRRHAFGALLTGPPRRLADVAETASRDAVAVASAIAWLDAHGQLERRGDLLVGAHGLTCRATAHAFTIAGRTLHTWCAYDALAIPVALGATTTATTTCPTCERPLAVDIDSGHLPDVTTPVLWMPTGPCTNALADFCAHANLFCTPDHLDTWRNTAGDPPGGPVALAQIPAFARSEWADIVPEP